MTKYIPLAQSGNGNPLDNIAKVKSNPKDVPSFKDTMGAFMKDVKPMARSRPTSPSTEWPRGKYRRASGDERGRGGECGF